MSVSHAENLSLAAMRYRDMGFSVIPLCPPNHHGVPENHMARCQSPGKAPLISKWERYSSTAPSREEVQQWWASWPTANVGGPTGPLWGLALDIDPRHDGDLQVGGLERPIPDTVTNLTGGGGTHYLFRWPEDLEIGNRVGLFQGVDVRGIGGQIVLPPSVHLSGRHYEWEGGFEPWEYSFAAPPAWLLETLQPAANGKGKTSRARPTELLSGVPEGQRNDSAAILAGRYLQKGLSREEVLDLLRSWNSRNRPPMGDSELIEVVNSIARRHHCREPEGPQQWSPRVLLDITEVESARSLDSFPKRFIRYASQRTDAPPEFLEASGLATLSAAVGRKARLVLTTGLIVPSLWVMLVADSTRYRKSTAIELGADILRRADLDVFAPDDFSPQRLVNLTA